MKSKEIADKILERVRREKSIRQPAIGRADVLFDGEFNAETFWIIRTKRQSATNFIRDIKGNILDTIAGPDPYLEEEGSTVVSRDGKFGGSLIATSVGRNRLLNEHNKYLESNVFTIAKYNPVPQLVDASQGIITTSEDTIRFANSLRDELRRLAELEEQVQAIEVELEDKRKTEEERRLLRLKLEQKQEELRRQQEKVKKFRIRASQLRGQAVLDPEQESIKRSRIFDGGLIIDGGPGTGKTTALIQRITFLTSPTILEYKPDLTPAEQKILFSDHTGWIFFSPSELLREYLRNAMDQEGLSADKSKVVVWDKYRSILFREFGFINPTTNRPFQVSSNRVRIFQLAGQATQKLISEFESFHFDRQRLKMKRMIEVNIADASWRNLAIKIREAVSGFENLSTYEQWIRLYTRLKDEFREEATRLSEEYRNNLHDMAELSHTKIKRDQEVSKKLDDELRSRFDKKVVSEVEEGEAEGEDVDEEEENQSAGLRYDFDVELNRHLRKLMRTAALSQFDKNTRFTKKAREDYAIVDAFVDKSRYTDIGQLALFRKYFHKLTRGAESNLFRELATSYKAFRRSILSLSDLITNVGKPVLRELIEDENRKVVEDEMELLLLCALRSMHALFGADQTLYDNSINLFVTAFKGHAKAVVAIDEATDFAPLQLACMAYLSHPKFRCYTLSGDLMQRLSRNGLHSWNEFTVLFPDAEKKTVRVSYRQTPTLLSIAKSYIQMLWKFMPYELKG